MLDTEKQEEGIVNRINETDSRESIEHKAGGAPARAKQKQAKDRLCSTCVQRLKPFDYNRYASKNLARATAR